MTLDILPSQKWEVIIIKFDLNEKLNINSLFLCDLAFADKGVRCCDAAYGKALTPHQQNSRCATIMFPDDDPFYGAYNVTCQNFIHAQDTLPLAELAGFGFGGGNKVNIYCIFIPSKMDSIPSI